MRRPLHSLTHHARRIPHNEEGPQATDCQLITALPDASDEIRDTSQPPRTPKTRRSANVGWGLPHRFSDGDIAIEHCVLVEYISMYIIGA